jgi:hypothetical protein
MLLSLRFIRDTMIKKQLEKAYKLRNIDIAYNAFTQEGDDE